MRHSKLAALCATVAWLYGCGPVQLDQGPQLPKPSAGFVAQQVFPGSTAQAFTTVGQVLAANQITVATAMPQQGQIVTDYVQGPSGSQNAIVVGRTQNVLYRFNIFITPEGRQSRITVKAVLQSRAIIVGNTSTNVVEDVSSANPGLVTQLQDWLYERIQTQGAVVSGASIPPARGHAILASSINFPLRSGTWSNRDECKMLTAHNADQFIVSPGKLFYPNFTGNGNNCTITRTSEAQGSYSATLQCANETRRFTGQLAFSMIDGRHINLTKVPDGLGLAGPAELCP